jgi:hypothetical protein
MEASLRGHRKRAQGRYGGCDVNSGVVCMAKLDATKEEIGHLKLWEGVLLVTAISLFGWGITNRDAAPVWLLLAAAGGVIGLSVGIMRYYGDIQRHIESLKDLKP